MATVRGHIRQPRHVLTYALSTATFISRPNVSTADCHVLFSSVAVYDECSFPTGSGQRVGPIQTTVCYVVTYRNTGATYYRGGIEVLRDTEEYFNLVINNAHHAHANTNGDASEQVVPLLLRKPIIRQKKSGTFCSRATLSTVLVVTGKECSLRTHLPLRQSHHVSTIAKPGVWHDTPTKSCQIGSGNHTKP